MNVGISSENIGPRFTLVGLGASAGGLDALERFFKNTLPDSGMAFVVVMHLSDKHDSLLPELLRKSTAMPVVFIDDGVTAERDHVYILPAGKNLDLLHGAFHVTDLPEKRTRPLPIDYFLRSLAAERHEMAVGIVLSGTGTDGTVGLSAIKGESGMTMVQSPESAKFPGMPQNAIEAGLADYVLTPEEMPTALIAYSRGPFITASRAVDKPHSAIEQSLPKILLKIRRRCGHDFSGYKTTTICRRIERRMNIHQIEDPNVYVTFLEKNDSEAVTLFKELLIGVTSFFRDPWVFESLATMAIMPMLMDRSDGAPFRVWVPSCATGEEAYSIAILIAECMDELQMHCNVQIFATDLDAKSVEKARAGLFPSGIGTDVSAERLQRFFVKKEGGFQIRKELRDWLVFAPQNVIHDPPFTKLDLVSCRNLLIYMQVELQRKLISLFHYSLLPGGCMLLGTSESIGEFAEIFDTLDAKAKLYRRKISSPGANRSVRFPIMDVSASDRQLPIAQPQQASVSMRDSITGMLASNFAPPTVIVTPGGDIVHVHGRTGQFLELATGRPSSNIISMAREGLELDLSSALRIAVSQDQPVIYEDIAVRNGDDTLHVKVVAQRIVEPSSLSGLVRISFLAPIDIEQTPVVAKTDAIGGLDENWSVTKAELRRELQRSREVQQRTIEALDASNEEMKSTNEELQSTNEELQSTNEELETSKEELQSLNEELQTVNAELHEKIRELSTINDDMNNLLNSTDIATLFLDHHLCIKRYTEEIKTIVPLIASDVGRSLRDLTSRLKYDGLLADAERVLKTLIPRELEVQAVDDRWILMRILPYRTSDDRIVGLVLTFVDIDASKRTRDDALAFMEHIVATVRQPLLVLDGKLRVRFANSSFLTTFQVNAEETLGHVVFDLGRKQWDIAELRHLLQEIMTRDTAFEDFEVTGVFPELGKQKMLLNARRIATDGTQPPLILLAIERVIEQ